MIIYDEEWCEGCAVKCGEVPEPRVGCCRSSKNFCPNYPKCKHKCYYISV